MCIQNLNTPVNSYANVITLTSLAHFMYIPVTSYGNICMQVSVYLYILVAS